VCASTWSEQRAKAERLPDTQLSAQNSPYAKSQKVLAVTLLFWPGITIYSNCYQSKGDATELLRMLRPSY
jgi:hypothetical protein